MSYDSGSNYRYPKQKKKETKIKDYKVTPFDKEVVKELSGIDLAKLDHPQEEQDGLWKDVIDMVDLVSKKSEGYASVVNALKSKYHITINLPTNDQR